MIRWLRLSIRRRRSKGINDAGSKVLFVIITDGLENYSQQYDQEKMKAKIAEQEKDGWEFVFIGANMDAEKEADTIGIKKENAVTYENSEQGVQANYQAVSQMVHSLANTSTLAGSPLEEFHCQRKIDYVYGSIRM
jgi:hypothetical protein